MDYTHQIPTIKGSAEVTWRVRGEVGANHAERELFQEGLPEGWMDAYQQVVGDGKGSITIGTDMGLKDFGNGATATVFVKLTCDQSEAGLNRAAELATNLAVHYADQARMKAEAKLQEAVTQGRVYFRNQRG